MRSGSPIFIFPPNRTKLELKRKRNNIARKANRTPNRTKLELKLCNFSGCNSTICTPNRTKLELKLLSPCALAADKKSPNRTKLELKQKKAYQKQWLITLPIAPSWNWNENEAARHRCNHFVSQSHQAGIETAVSPFRIPYPVSSQSHQAGIETDFPSSRKILIPDSQSHQAGIETCIIVLE